MKALLIIARTLSIRWRAIVFFILLSPAVVRAQSQPAAGTTQPAARVMDEALDLGWPRLYRADWHEVVVHQPQIDRWDKYATLHIRAAIVIRKSGTTDSAFGSVQATAPTSVDLDARTVFIGPRKVESLVFSDNQPPAEVERLRKIMLAALPDEMPMTMSLDRVFAAVAAGEKEPVRSAAVNLDAPPIYYSETPAALVILAGKPRLENIEGIVLKFVANTNWDIFFEPTSNKYYLLNTDHWLMTGDLLKGDWTAATALPVTLTQLPDDENWQDVRRNYPGKRPATIDKIIVSTTPAELILTDGKPEFAPIEGTKLLQAMNTDSDLFMHATEQQYYLLAAGRWFRTKDLKAGAWTAATTDLPADFASIPETSDAAEVLVSVPGTQLADEAVLQASTPQKATINRNEVTMAVTYEGDPKFEVIEGTSIKYATNTPSQVFNVEGRYYCCFDGVWFESAAAFGPWAVCEKVPQVIYTIPPTHPAHNVTYVYVYESTPTTVVVGSTAGYTGQYIAEGVVMFGAGIITGAILASDDVFWRYGYSTAYFSYGCGARYSYYHGGYYGHGAARYGPYGGAGAWSGYNPSTGRYSRGAYRYGPNGSVSARSSYNPWTGNSAGRVGASTPYGSWGRSAVSNGEDWARGGYNSSARGTVGGVRTSEGTGFVAGRDRYGNSAAVAKDRDGDVYVGRNGNTYKRDDDGGWYKREDGDWERPEGDPRTPRANSNSSNAQARRDAARTSDRTHQDLDRQARARDRGASSSQRAAQRSSQPAARPSRGGGGGGRRGR